MALIIPNVAEIAKKDAKLAEAVQQVQVYTTNNVTQVVGNAVTPPPLAKTPTSAPRSATPPSGHIKVLIG